MRKKAYSDDKIKRFNLKSRIKKAVRDCKYSDNHLCRDLVLMELNMADISELIEPANDVEISNRYLIKTDPIRVLPDINMKNIDTVYVDDLIFEALKNVCKVPVTEVTVLLSDPPEKYIKAIIEIEDNFPVEKGEKD